MRLWGIGALAFSLAVVAGGLVSACGDSNLGTPGQGGGDGGAGSCPSTQPTNGSTCLLANNTTCNYGAAETPNCECCGGGVTFLCSNGKWEEEATAGAGSTPAAPACPETVPEAGSACTGYSYGPCGGEAPEQVCSYGCTNGGSQEATCNGSSWTISTTGDCSDDGGDAGDGGDASDGG